MKRIRVNFFSFLSPGDHQPKKNCNFYCITHDQAIIKQVFPVSTSKQSHWFFSYQNTPHKSAKKCIAAKKYSSPNETTSTFFYFEKESLKQPQNGYAYEKNLQAFIWVLSLHISHHRHHSNVINYLVHLHLVRCPLSVCKKSFERMSVYNILGWAA